MTDNRAVTGVPQRGPEGGATVSASPREASATGRPGKRRGSRAPGVAPESRALAPAATWWVAAALGVAGAVLSVLVRRHLSGGDFVFCFGGALAGIYYASLGVLVVRRAGNVIGWLLLGDGIALAAETVANGYAIADIKGSVRLPGAELTGLFAEWLFVPVIAGTLATFLLFPDGRLPSRRWRPVGWLGIAVTGLSLAGVAVHPRMVELAAPGGDSATFPNPLGVTSLGPLWSTVLVGTLDAVGAVSVPWFAAAAAALVVRFRAGGREMREQIKWLACMMALLLVAQAVGAIGTAIAGTDSNPVTDVAYIASPIIALAGLPAVVTLAILKYRLYQIDVVINRTVKYALLSAVLTAVYAAIVLGIGTAAGYAGGPVLTVIAAVAVAVLFQPARSRAQLLANRLVYGRRATPYQVLSDFADHMAGQLDPAAALTRMAALLGGAAGAVTVQVWVRVGEEFRPEVSWPAREAGPGEAGPGETGPGGTGPGDAGPGEAWPGEAGRPVRRDDLFPAAGSGRQRATERTAEVRHSGELLGALTLVKPADEPVSADEERLLANVASQAGLVLRNTALTAQLRASIEDLTASRRRLVRAQDEERHRIERNLHDGAQQQLVALAMLLRLVEDAAEDPAEVRELTAQLRDGVQAAIDELRALARGIYPPLLAEQGLPAALRAQAARAPLPVRVDVDGVGRYRREAEAAVYFCALEALQNAAKYAGAGQAVVALGCRDGQLEFSVTDDGAGFDAATVTGGGGREGTGLTGMADRLSAAGGNLLIRSAPGRGTVVSGRIPV